MTSPIKIVGYNLVSLPSKVIHQSHHNVMYPITSPKKCLLQFNLTNIKQSHFLVSPKCNVSNNLTKKTVCDSLTSLISSKVIFQSHHNVMYQITSQKNVCDSLTSPISSKVILQSHQNIMYPITSPINNCWLLASPNVLKKILASLNCTILIV